MKEENKNNVLVDIVKSESFISALIIGVAFPIVAWTIEFIRHRVNVSFIGIGEIHHINALLYIIDLVPGVLVVGAYFLDKQRIAAKSQFVTRISESEALMNAMADFAKKIGEGDYHSQLTINTDQDILAESLLIMRDNLLQNSKKETEQSWIAEGKETISHILRQHNKIDELSAQVIQSLVQYTRLVQGAIYLYNEDRKTLIMASTYAYNRRKFLASEFKVGYGLIGQCAYEMDYIYRTEIPDDYVTVTSGIIGDQKPKSLLLIPLITDEKLQGVIEFASTDNQIPDLTIRLLKELGEIIARTFFNLKINERTEKLLVESQQMTLELQENEEELRQNAEEMRATQEELKKSNEHLETQIQEVENAQKPDPSEARGFSITPGQIPVGAPVRDITLTGAGEDELLLVLSSTSIRAFDGAGLMTASLDIASAFDTIVPFDGRSPFDDEVRRRALLWGTGETRLGFLDIDTSDALVARDVDLVDLVEPVAALVTVPDRKLVVAVHDSGRLSLVNLEERTVSPISAGAAPAATLLDAPRGRLWVATDAGRVGSIDLATLAGSEILLQPDTVDLRLVPGAKPRVALIHRSSAGHVTLLDAAHPSRQGARELLGFLWSGLLD